MVLSRPVFRPLADNVVLALLAIVTPVVRRFAGGPARFPRAREFLKRHGVFPIPDHYYAPLFNDAQLTQPLFEPRSLPAIDWNHSGQLALLRRVNYTQELLALRLDDVPIDDSAFTISNGQFESGDADFLYSMIRHLKPRRLIEVGSGHSTKIASLAIKANESEGGHRCEHICVEPFEAPWLDALDVTVLRNRVEELGTSFFAGLQANDLLFIDSSHVIRPQGDVLFEYLQLLPALECGVYVHVHDIFSPRDYPDDWVRHHVRMWNEQYLLEALLSHTNRYQVVAARNYLRHSEYDRLSPDSPMGDVSRA